MSAPADYPVTPSNQVTAEGRQGVNAIAIGAYASAKAQSPNSIVINATGGVVNSAGTGTTVIQSLRQSSSVPSGFNQVYWNPTTGELIVVTGV